MRRLAHFAPRHFVPRHALESALQGDVGPCHEGTTLHEIHHVNELQGLSLAAPSRSNVTPYQTF